MKNRVTIKYRSADGNEYLYDDVSSMIFPWNDTLESVLELSDKLPYEEIEESLEGQYPQNEVKDAVSFIRYWRENARAFFRERPELAELPSSEEICGLIGKDITVQLILSVTDDCNLRCKYCIYSDSYYYTKNKTVNHMSTETAKKAVDYFFEHVRLQIERNPRKVFGITFYGGEPLINMPVVKYVVEYVKQKYPGKAYFMMTTNGLLLNDDNVRFLVENDVNIAISIDGPKSEHDRLRVRIDDSGSFDEVMNNIRKIKENYPEYFATKVNTVCVFDLATDTEKTEEFFRINERLGKVPRVIFANRVSDNNTDYYKKFSQDDFEKYNERTKKLREKFIQNKIGNMDASSYLTVYSGFPVMALITRRRPLDSKAPYIPLSGACVPGQKMCVNSSGTIDICERVNGSNPIGHVDTGLDPDKILNIIKEYRNNVLSDCYKCPVTKLCGLCYLNFEGEHEITKKKQACGNFISSMKESFSTYSTICENNPHAQFFFDSDTAELITAFMRM